MWIQLLLTVLYCLSVSSIELTFELPDNEVQCFYEDMKAGVLSIIEFQVSVDVSSVCFVHYDL